MQAWLANLSSSSMFVLRLFPVHVCFKNKLHQKECGIKGVASSTHLVRDFRRVCLTDAKELLKKESGEVDHPAAKPLAVKFPEREKHKLGGGGGACSAPRTHCAACSELAEIFDWRKTVQCLIVVGLYSSD